jgi:hypothetical protein
MAYIVNNSRGQIIAVVQDGTVDVTATSQTLVGKNVTPYGQYEVENLVHQLENFADSSAPPNPIEGQLWYDIANSNVNVYTGTQWKSVSNITVTTSAPSNPTVGNLWFNPNTQQIRIYSAIGTGFGWIPSNKLTVATSAPTALVSGEMYFNSNTNQFFVYNSSAWNLIGPDAVSGFATTRWSSNSLLDINSNPHAVVECAVDGEIVAIASNDTFTILQSQRPAGFVQLIPGINLSNTSTFNGVASSALQLAVARTINNVAFDGTSNILIGSAGNLTPGNYLTGYTYTGLTGQTWSVDATSLNTPFKVVARDPQGDFSAGTITANLIGDVIGSASEVSGIVDSAHGGTGFASYSAGQILIGNAAGALNQGNIVGSGPINVALDGANILVSYSGGTGTGNVTSVGLLPGTGIGISGSPITGSGNITVTNTGVTRLNAGGGLSGDSINGNVTLTNTGVRSIVGGAGITANTSTGNIGLTNTGVTSIIAGQNVSVSAATGAVTINATPGTAGVASITAGSGMSVSGATGAVTLTNIGVTQLVAGNNISLNRSNGVVTVTAAVPSASSAVTKLIAGTNVTLSPANGLGEVTITAAGSSSGNISGINAGTGLTGGGVSGVVTLALANVTSVVGGQYRNPTITIDSYGRVINASNGTTSGTVTQITTGAGLTGGTINTSGTIAVDSSVLLSNAAQTITAVKTFTGGVISQAYNFTPAGASIFYADQNLYGYQEPVVSIPVNAGSPPYAFTHQFYNKRFVCEGSADRTTPSSDRPAGAAIIGIDNGNSGGAGVSGWHTSAQAGIGIGVSAYATNLSFTGAVFQGVSIRNASNDFIHFRSYSGVSPVFQVTGAGDVSADGTYTTPAGDYAEYFEWADGNPNAEDRTGFSVSLVGNQIRIAEPGDTAIGVVSVKPSMVGDAAELQWNQQYLKDAWGREILEPYYYYEWTDDEGKSHSKASYDNSDVEIPNRAVKVETDGHGNPLMTQKLNPDYDPAIKYIPRSQRPEWSAVGLMGKLRMHKGQVVGATWIKLRDITDAIEEWLVK